MEHRSLLSLGPCMTTQVRGHGTSWPRAPQNLCTYRSLPRSPFPRTQHACSLTSFHERRPSHKGPLGKQLSKMTALPKHVHTLSLPPAAFFSRRLHSLRLFVHFLAPSAPACKFIFFSAWFTAVSSVPGTVPGPKKPLNKYLWNEMNEAQTVSSSRTFQQRDDLSYKLF